MPFDPLLLNTREWRLVAGRLRHKLPTLYRRPVLRWPTMAQQDKGRSPRILVRLLNVEPGEVPAVAASLLMFFLLFTGYFMLRPVSETVGVASGPETLQWLFTGTFVATVAVLPLFGWVASKVSRRSILPWTYGFFVANLIGFAAVLAAQPDDVWTARAFYIWLSVFILLAVSLAWSALPTFS
jgi:ATP:ADP antiporter, AAA family